MSSSQRIDHQDDLKNQPTNIHLLHIIHTSKHNLLNTTNDRIKQYVNNVSKNGLIHLAHELVKTELKQPHLTLSDKENILEVILKSIVEIHGGNSDQLLEFIDDTIIPTVLHLFEEAYSAIAKVEACIVDQTKECCKDKCERIKKKWCCCFN